MLMAPGYWPDTIWPDYYWPDDYWPDYGLVVTVPTHGEVTYAQFDVVGTWKPTAWGKSPGKFYLRFEDTRGTLKREIPTDLYDRTTYPNMEDDQEGEPIPTAYGKIFDIRPTCVDTVNYQFKVASHAISQFTGCRVKSDGTGETEATWTAVNFATTTEATATFTLSAVDWDGKAEVAVDFEGKLDTNSVLMENASDIVNNILTVVLGEPSAKIHSASFASSRAKLLVGTDYAYRDVNYLPVSLYLNKTQDAGKYINEINKAVGSYLYPDHDGKFRYVVFEPSSGAALSIYDDREVFSITEDEVTEDIVSKVIAGYQRRQQQDYSQRTVQEKAEYQYHAAMSSEIQREIEVPSPLKRAGQYVAQRTIRMDGPGARMWTLELSHRAWTMMPGDQFILQYDRFGINSVVEALDVKRDLNKQTVKVVVGNIHGMEDHVGFWSANAPTFPASLGGGTCAAWDDTWTDAQKAYAKQNHGYWTDDNGYADATDSESRMPGAWF